MDRPPSQAKPSSASASLSTPDCNTGTNDKLLVSQQGSDGGKNDRFVSLKETSLLDIEQDEYVKGIHTLTKEVRSFIPEKDKLVQKRKAINDGLETLRKRQKVSENKLMEATKSLKAKLAKAGISDTLWLQYENFCASSFLQPDLKTLPQILFMAPKEEFKDWYIKYDPNFTEIQKLGLLDEGRYWRCDRVTTYSRSGQSFEYIAKFKKLKDTSESFKSWAERFPALYAKAIQAAREGSTAALEMLIALPDADDRGESGNFFEFAYEEPLGSGLTQMKKLWKFRASHDLSKPIKSEEKRASLIQKYNLPFKVTNKDQIEPSADTKC